MSNETTEHLKKELAEAHKRISELEAALYERNRVEAAVKGSEESFRRLVENAHDVLWVFDLNLGYTYVSPSVKLLRGYSVEEVMKQKLEDVLTPESVKKARTLFEREIIREFSGHHHPPEWSFTSEFEMIHKNGSTFWAEMTMNPFYDETGNIRGIMGVTRGISERKRAEEQLRRHQEHLEEQVKERTRELSLVVERLMKEITDRMEAEDRLRMSEERFRTYFELSQDVMVSYDSQLRVQNVTPNVERILGYTPEEMVGKTFLDLGILHPDSFNDAIGNALKVLSGEAVHAVVYEFVTREGKRIFGEVSGVPLLRDGKVEGEVSVARDITERVSMQQSLQESEERYRTTLHTLPDAVSIMSATSVKYVYVNDAFCALTGYSLEEVMGSTPCSLSLPASPADIEGWEHVLDHTGPVTKREHQLRTKQGAVLDTIISARPVTYDGKPCIVMIITDITALKQIADEQQQIEMRSQKMEAIGTLAAGIAHDFNNILTTIIGYAKMSMKDFMAATEGDKDLSVVRGDLTEVSNAAYRARDLVNHILAFSRHSEKDLSRVNLGDAVRGSLKLLRPSLPAKIRIREAIDDDLHILGDPSQLHLVMTNLCTNAVSAMDKAGGTLEVTIGPASADEVPPDMDAPEGPCVKLTVRDTGRGMSPQTMARIFDPYFTTRGKGQGAGLGLSVIHGIVKSHGGTITCTSLSGKGTTFSIFLPRCEPAGSGLPKREEAIEVDEDSMILDLDQEALPGKTGRRKAAGKGTPAREKKYQA